MSSCVFCEINESGSQRQLLESNRYGFAIRDGFPLTEGHSLIIPRRHVGSFFALTQDEQIALLGLLDSAKRDLDSRYNPDGFTVGINDGPAAGQTVPHVHIHLIPRYSSEGGDPRGGVRWVVPDKADYWSEQ